MMNPDQLPDEALVHLICQRADSGSTTTPADLATVTGIRLEQVFSAVNRLVERGLLRPTEHPATPLPHERLEVEPDGWTDHDAASGRDTEEDLDEKQAMLTRVEAELSMMEATDRPGGIPVLNGERGMAIDRMAVALRRRDTALERHVRRFSAK